MDNQNRSVLDDERVGRLLLKLSIPAFFGMFVMVLYNVVDTIFIGHYVGPLGIAGLSMVFPVQMLSMGIGLMTGMGGASLISRLIGSGQAPRAEQALGNAVTANLAFSVVITIAGLANVDFWLRLMGTSETILPYARDYMTIILFGMLFQTFGMALSYLIRAEGNTRVPMVGMIIGAVLNAAFCAVFVIGLGMGVKGSALATVIAQFLSALYFMSYYFSGKNLLKFHARNLIIRWDILKEILAIGTATMVMSVASSLSAVLVNRMLVAYGGDMAVSAYGIVNRTMMFAGMPSIVIGQGLQPILGFNYGARRYDRALKAIWLAIGAATVCSIIAFIFLYFTPEISIRVFTADSELIALGAYAMKRIFFVIYLMGFIMVGSTLFQAIGKAFQSFVTAAARPVLFLIPLVLVMPRFWHLEGVWLAFPITDALTFALTLALFIPQIKMFRSMAAEVGAASR